MLEGLREWWENFSYSLEEKGIPAWVIPLALLVLLAAGYLYLFPSQQTASVSVSVFSPANDPISGASVTLEGNGVSKTVATNANGEALFQNIPPGNYDGTVSSAQFVFPDAGSFTASAAAGETARQTLYSQLSQAKKVSLSASVDGPEAARIQLYDSDGNLVDERLGKTAFFSVDPNAQYTIKANADGFTGESKDVNVGSSDVPEQKITLLESGEEKKGILYVGVFDDVGVEGNPIQGANVTAFDSATNSRLFSLETGEAGTIEPQKLALGRQITIVLQAEGFAPQTKTEAVAAESEVKFRLIASVEPKGFFLRAADEKGNPVAGALVQLLSGESVVGEQTSASDGTADFPGVEKSKTYSALAFKTGFLPVFKQRVSSGEQLKVETAGEENSAMLTVKVVDSKGQQIPNAFVILQDESGKPIGFPARETGVDGVQAWENTPVRKMIAVASKDGRLGKSRAFIAKNGTEIQITLPPTQGTVLAVASDQFTLQPIRNAVVSLVSEDGSAAKCTTGSKGECTAKILEGKVTASVSASGFEEFQSSEFQVLPGAQAKQEFHLVSSGAAQAGLYFQGIFDLQGNRVKTLSPFSTYNVKYSLASGGLEFTQANAHVRIGAQDEPLESLPAIITNYKNAGGIVQKGIDYSQSTTFIPATQTRGGQNKVLIAPNAFVPANIVIQAGDSVSWVSQDSSSQHSIRADDESFSSPQLNSGASFSRTFNQEGVFYYSDGLKPSVRASITVVAKQKASGAQTQVKGVKWVDYSFPQFKGTKEISIQIKTVASSGGFSLEHRSALALPGGTLRKPEDAQAGAGKSELLAETLQSGLFEISTQGNCDKTLCVQYWFDNGKQSFEAPYAQEFKMHLRVYSGDSPQEITLAGDSALEIKALEPAKGNSETASVQSNSATLAVQTQGGAGDAVAAILPRKLASDATLKLKAGTLEKTIRLRVVAKEKLSFIETHSPQDLTALEQTKLAFKVKDSAGFPVDNAAVSFNGIQFSETKEEGTYEATITPDFVGEGEVQIAKEGFESFKGAVRVKTPDALVRITPNAIQTAFTQPASVTLELENLLKNEVTVESAVIEPFDDTAYTAFEITPVEKKSTALLFAATPPAPVLKASERKDFTLGISLKQGALPFASRPTRLRETIKGYAVFVFNVGGFLKEQRVPLQIETDFQQKTLDELWSIETPEASFSLSLDKPSEEKKVRIASESPLPLLIGFDLKEQGLSANPASLIIEPNGLGEVTLTKAITPEMAADCFSLAGDGDSKLSIIASYQGVASKKELPVKMAFSRNQVCKPENAVEVSLPFATELMIYANAEARENADGGVAMRVGGKGGEVFAFDSGASVSEAKDRIAVPVGTKMFLPQARALKQGNTVRVSFPVDSRMEMASNAQVQNNAQGGFNVMMPRSIVSFPASVVLGTEGGRTVAVVPKGTGVDFVSLAENSQVKNQLGGGQYVDPSLINPMPYDPLQLSLPIEFLMRFPGGSRVIDPQQSQQQASNMPGFWNYYAQYYPQNVRGVFTPPQSKFAFSAEARITQAAAGLVEVAVPRDSTFYAPQGTARFLDKDVVAITFPTPVELRFPANAIVIEDAKTKRKNTVKAAEDVAVQFPFDVQLREGGGAKAILVPPFATVVFLKGAAASLIDDPNTYSKCDFVFTTTEDSSIAISGAKYFESSNPKIALLPECTKLEIKSKDGKKEIATTPKVKRVEANELTSLEKGLSIPAGTSVKFKVCNPEKSDEESKRASITFSKASAISLPAQAREKAAGGEISFGGKHKEILIVDEGARYKIGQTDKLSITPKEKILVPEKADADGRILVGIPAQSRISFIPTCEETSGDVVVKGSVPMVITEQEGATKDVEAITVTLNNSLLEGQSGTKSRDYEKPIFISNPGSSEFEVAEISADGDVKKAFRKGFFTETTEQGDNAVIGPFADAQENAKLVFYIPEEAIEQTASGFGSCIKEDKPYVFEGNVVFGLLQKDEEDKKTLKTKVVLDAKAVPCTAKKIEEQLKERNRIRDGTGAGVGGAGGTAAAATFASPEGTPDFDGEKAFSFKASGHKRYYAYTNNLAEPLQISFPNDGQQISCFYYSGKRGDSVASGRTLGVGQSILLECEAKSAGESDYKIVAKGVKTKAEKERVLKVQVFTPPAGSETLYSSTPIGILLFPPEKKLPTPAPLPAVGAPEKKTTVEADVGLDYAYCENNFCTYSSAISAVKNFMAVTSTAFDAQTSEKPGVDAICAYIGGEKHWQMSFILLMSNTKLASNLNKDMTLMAQEMSRNSKFQGVKVSEQAKVEFTGCGAYLVEARLNPVSAGGSFCDFDPTKNAAGKKPMQIEFRTQKLVSCEETLANAPLLMPIDDTVFITGNEVIDNIFDMRFSAPYIEIGKYSEDASEKDLENAEKLASSLYTFATASGGKMEAVTNAGGVVETAKPYYDDPVACEENIRHAKNWIGGTQLVGAGASAIIGLFYAPSWRATLNLASSYAQTQAACQLVRATSATNSCTATDFCTHLGFVLAADALTDSLFPVPLPSGTRQIAKTIFGDTLFTAGTSAIAGGVEDPSAIPYAGSQIAKLKGALSGSQPAAGTQAQAPVTGEFLANQPAAPITGFAALNELSPAELRALGRTIRTEVNSYLTRTLPGEDFKLTVGFGSPARRILTVQATALTQQEKSVVEAEMGEIVKRVLGQKGVVATGEQVGVRVAIVPPTGGGEPVPKPVPKRTPPKPPDPIKPVTPPTTSGGTTIYNINAEKGSQLAIGDNNRQVMGGGTGGGEGSGKPPTEPPSPQVGSGEPTAKEPKPQKTGYSRYGRFLTRFAVGAVLNFFTNVQSEPVEGVLGESFINYAIAMHYTDKTPSMTGYCYFNPATQQCDKQNRLCFEGTDVCEGKDACLYLQKIKIPYANAVPVKLNVPAYMLLFAENKPGDYENLFSALFNPDVEPVAVEGVTAQLTDKKLGGECSYSTDADAEQVRNEGESGDAKALANALLNFANSGDAPAEVKKIANDELNAMESASLVVNARGSDGKTITIVSIVSGKESEFAARAQNALQKINEAAGGSA